MEFANIVTTVTRTEEYADSEPAQRGTWFSMLCYCCSMENSGVIANCRDWKSRKWEQMMGITKDEAESDCKLWTWEGDSIVVCFYPIAAQDKVQAKSSAGRMGGMKSGLVRAARSKIEAPVIVLQAPGEAHFKSASNNQRPAPAECLNKTEEKEREQNQTKENGTEGKETAAAPPKPALPPIERCRQLIDYLNPTWSRLPRWGSEDEHALSECLPNLLALERKDWQILAYFLRWTASAANTQARDPEKVTSKRANFIQDLSSYLDRATRHWKSSGCPKLETSEHVAASPVPEPSPTVPEFATQADRAAYFRSLLPDA